VAVGLHDRHSFLLLGETPVGVSDALAGTIEILVFKHGATASGGRSPFVGRRQRQSE
jgi:hypothetical protein